LPDHYGLTKAMLFACIMQLLELLDTAAYYRQSAGLLEQEEELEPNERYACSR